MTVEQQQQKDTYADRRVGQVKDRTEKDKLFSSPHREPVGQHRLYQREIEHIDHLPVQPAGIAATFRHKRGNLSEAMIEHHPIEYGVDDIPDSPRKDQRDTGDKAKRVISMLSCSCM